MTLPATATLPPAPAPARRSRLAAGIRWLVAIMLAAVAALACLIMLWAFIPPVSTLMAARWMTLRPVERTWIPLGQMSPHLLASVIASEDAGFCRHRGVDWGALREQLRAEDGPARGASTLAMQTAKNLFLWPGASYVRKGLEIPLALTLDAAWGKRRMLEIYLNIAEWGPGVFGAEAAAKRYFGKTAARLSAREAALLATALPNPWLRNPAKPTRRHGMLTGINLRRAQAAPRLMACLHPG